jgi:hypothetical protein
MSVGVGEIRSKSPASSFLKCKYPNLNSQDRGRIVWMIWQRASHTLEHREIAQEKLP